MQPVYLDGRYFVTRYDCNLSRNETRGRHCPPRVKLNATNRLVKESSYFRSVARAKLVSQHQAVSISHIPTACSRLWTAPTLSCDRVHLCRRKCIRS